MNFKIMHKVFRFIFCTVLSLTSLNAFSWGAEGHAMIARLALQMAKADTKNNVLNVLGSMSVDTAANWMDIVKSNRDYDFMKPWHYVNYAKGTEYKTTNADNIANRLFWTKNELEHKRVLSEAQVKMDLCIIIHLIGDLHMPLHTGYAEDLGGNKIMVQYDTLKTHNLHRFWDEDILRLTGITDASVLSQNNVVTNLKSDIDFFEWMKESRVMLDKVYDFEGFILETPYLQRSKTIAEQQLYKAAVRLALVLDILFRSPTPSVDFKVASRAFKNIIEAEDAINHVGKNVTVCSKVYGVRSTDKITQINLSAPFPNSPLTIIIFGSNYSKFAGLLTEMFMDKNICVKGKIELYKDKPQIIISNPSELLIQ